MCVSHLAQSSNTGCDADSYRSVQFLKIHVMQTERQLCLVIGFGSLGGLTSIALAHSTIIFDVSAITVIVALLCSIQGAMYLPTFLAVLTLPYQLSSYPLNLHTMDPANSQIIARLHRILISNIFFLGIFAAFIAIWLWFFGLLQPQIAIVFVGIQWTLIVSTFLIGQYGLVQIIHKAKQQKLQGYCT